MKNRVTSGAIIIVMSIAAILTSQIPFIFNAYIAILAVMALYEVLTVSNYIEGKMLRKISLFYAALIPFLPKLVELLPTSTFSLADIIVGLIFVYSTVMFCILLGSKGKYSLEHFCVVFSMSVIIPLFFTTFVLMNKKDVGILYIILVLLCTWGADVGGYTFGRLFGRKKLAPTVSPKKTIGGTIGALVTSISAMIFLGYCVSVMTSGEIEVNYISLLLCGVLGGVFSVIGDLFASIIKRGFGVKDFGSLIPGHGGIMDRFDSVLFASPMLYIITTLLPPFISCGVN